MRPILLWQYPSLLAQISWAASTAKKHEKGQHSTIMPHTHWYELRSLATDQYHSGWHLVGSRAEGNCTSNYLWSWCSNTHAAQILTVQRPKDIIHYGKTKRWRKMEERNTSVIPVLQTWVPKVYWLISSAPKPSTSIPPYHHCHTQTVSNCYGGATHLSIYT